MDGRRIVPRLSPPPAGRPRIPGVPRRAVGAHRRDQPGPVGRHARRAVAERNGARRGPRPTRGGADGRPPPCESLRVRERRSADSRLRGSVRRDGGVGRRDGRTAPGPRCADGRERRPLPDVRARSESEPARSRDGPGWTGNHASVASASPRDHVRVALREHGIAGPERARAAVPRISDVDRAAVRAPQPKVDEQAERAGAELRSRPPRRSGARQADSDAPFARSRSGRDLDGARLGRADRRRVLLQPICQRARIDRVGNDRTRDARSRDG